MKPAIFFDLDGTLSDPKRGVFECLSKALIALDRPVPALKDLDWMIGPPLSQSMEKLVGPHLAPEALKLYRIHYDEGGWRENDPYPKVSQMLSDCQKLGVPMFVVTSKLAVFAKRIITHFCWDKFFKGVYGEKPEFNAFNGGNHDKALLLAAVKQNYKITTGVMIGDRLFDCRAAKSNGFGSIGVLWGYGSKVELEQAGCDALAVDPGEIVGLCESFIPASFLHRSDKVVF